MGTYVEEREYNRSHKAVVLLVYLHEHAGKRVTRQQVKRDLGFNHHHLRDALRTLDYVIGHKLQLWSDCILYIDKDRPGI
jgi:DNA-binding response OmpR family regulator